MINPMQAIIWMSPWNSYFKDREVAYLLKEAINRYGKVAIMIADIPAVSTYQAMGYTLSKSQEKARLQWNALKNRTKRVLQEMWFSLDDIAIIDWGLEIEPDEKYIAHRKRVQELYDTNATFYEDVNATSLSVLQNSGKDFSQESVFQAVHYLLSEIAFLEFSRGFFDVEKTWYLYHKNRDVFEYYIAGKYDGVVRTYLDFVLLEAPYETYLSYADSQKSRWELIQQRWILHCSFIPYFSYFIVWEQWNHSGKLFDIMKKVGEKNNITIDFSEQIGYGSIAWRLNTGSVDVFWCPTRASKKRRLQMFFSKPLFHSPVFGYMRSDSKYLSVSIEHLQTLPELRIAVKENDIHHELASKFFPNAILVRVPQLSHIWTVLEFVRDKKADLTFRDPELVSMFCNSRWIDSSLFVKVSNNGNPFEVYDNCIALPWGEFELKRVIDECIEYGDIVP